MLPIRIYLTSFTQYDVLIPAQRVNISMNRILMPIIDYEKSKVLLHRGKEILERLGSARFSINQTFPRFPPSCYARRKAREILIFFLIMQIKVILTFFPFSHHRI